ILAALTLPAVLVAQDRSTAFSEAEMRMRVQTLSANDFEGRGPGTVGGRKAAQFIASQLKAAGVKPAKRGTYFQDVRLMALKADPSTKLRATTKKGTDDLKFGDDMVLMTGAQTPRTTVNAEV